MLTGCSRGSPGGKTITNTPRRAAAKPTSGPVRAPAPGKPRWIVAAEVLETTRRYLRTCARIDPDWVEPLAEHLVHRTYSEPHWDRAAASAFAFEKVSLLGLPIVPRRRWPYGPIDPETARQLLIQHGLVEGQWDREPRFLKHNRQVLAEVEEWEQKLRRNDLRPSEWRATSSTIAGCPRTSATGRGSCAGSATPNKRTAAAADDHGAVPRRGSRRQRRSGLPGQGPRGVGRTALGLPLRTGRRGGRRHRQGAPAGPEPPRRPTPRLAGARPAREKDRRLDQLAAQADPPTADPRAETARRVAGQVTFGEGDVLAAIARLLGQLVGEPITPATFDPEKLPPELTMNIRVVDSEGKTLAMGRNLAALRRELASDTVERVAEVKDPRFPKDGITTWDFGELPERVEIHSGGLRLDAYPTLLDRGESVRLDISASPEQAVQRTRGGLRRLFFLAARGEIRSQVAWLPKLEQMVLWSASLRQFDLNQQLADLIADRAFVADRPIPRDRAGFELRLKEGRDRIEIAVQDVAEVAPALFEAYHSARVGVDELAGSRFRYAADDAAGQIEQLVGPRFLTETPWPWLKHFPRYLRAIAYRFDKLRSGGQARDLAGCEEVRDWWQKLQQTVTGLAEAERLNPALIQFRWMLEEYRVSLFAQPLGTAVPVSAKRLEKQWSQVQGGP